MPARPTIDAETAAGVLRVTRATLYAYVSRGLIGTEPDPTDPRRRRYLIRDIERLRDTKARGRAPKAVAAAALHWGDGSIPSRLTLVANGRLFYRGAEAVDLAAYATLEEIARRLWAAGTDDPFARTAPESETTTRVLAMRWPEVAPLDRCRAQLALLGEAARGMAGRAPARLCADGASLLRFVAAAMLARAIDDAPIHHQIAAAFGLDAAGAGLIRAALVLVADHELNASTFATRVAASTGASLAACIGAGLAALSGPRHGGMTALVEAVWDEVDRVGDAGAIVEARVRRGETIPGMDHPLYPDGDPRARFILARLPPDAARETLVSRIDDIAGQRPNIDFALVALRRALGLPRGAALELFAIARTVGWIAHALEQNADGTLIRPRAVYVGAMPGS